MLFRSFGCFVFFGSVEDICKYNTILLLLSCLKGDWFIKMIVTTGLEDTSSDHCYNWISVIILVIVLFQWLFVMLLRCSGFFFFFIGVESICEYNAILSLPFCLERYRFIKLIVTTGLEETLSNCCYIWTSIATLVILSFCWWFVLPLGSYGLLFFCGDIEDICKYNTILSLLPRLDRHWFMKLIVWTGLKSSSFSRGYNLAGE